MSIALLALTGCTVEVREPTPVPEVVIPSPGTAERHDVALVSLQFDPPLSTISSLSAAQQVKLVAVLDNRGSQTERSIVVAATLRAVATSEVLAMQMQVVEQLAPGEARVVRFGDLGSVPTATQYAITVRVAPVPGEVLLANNERTLVIDLEPQQ